MHESQKCYAEQKKTDTKDYSLYVFICRKFQNRQNLSMKINDASCGWERGGLTAKRNPRLLSGAT